MMGIEFISPARAIAACLLRLAPPRLLLLTDQQETPKETFTILVPSNKVRL